MKTWKGRFTGGLHPEALQFSTSLGVDRKLFEEDIRGSLAHVRMLARTKIITSGEARKISAGLRGILDEYRKKGPPRPSVGRGERFVAEDIHMAIESALISRIGNAGKKLHTARSRNDQVALDERLFLSGVLPLTRELLRGLQHMLVHQAMDHVSTIMPGYTHLQRAQPVLLAHHLLAYVEMFERDHERFIDCERRASRSPLGAGALAGTSFPIDRETVAAELGLRGTVANSIDAVADRDALLEFIGGCAITMMHLSRLAEELVLWSSHEWSFAIMDDAFATGSSIMPQKKNPDMAELIRGKTGRVYGALMTLLTVMKGLPLAYNRDMQEDKEPLFDAARTTLSSLRIMALMIGSVTFRRDRFEEELRKDFSLATDYADYLVRKGIPFRSAHAVVGAIVKRCEERGVTLETLTLKDLRAFSPAFGPDALALADPRHSVASKKSAGSTAPSEVRKALRRWEKKLH